MFAQNSQMEKTSLQGERLGWRDCGKAYKIKQIKRPLPPFATLRRGKVENHLTAIIEISTFTNFGKTETWTVSRAGAFFSSK